MTTWIPISYRGFWDVPRIFHFRYRGHAFLFDCAFDPDLDDYPDDYQVYLLPADLHEENFPTDWTTLADRATRLGTVPVRAVTFDPTLRKQVNAAIVEAFVPEPARTP